MNPRWCRKPSTLGSYDEDTLILNTKGLRSHKDDSLHWYLSSLPSYVQGAKVQRKKSLCLFIPFNHLSRMQKSILTIMSEIQESDDVFSGKLDITAT